MSLNREEIEILMSLFISKDKNFGLNKKERELLGKALKKEDNSFGQWG